MTNKEGPVALVTGASRGIGRAVAARLAEEGAFVFINYFSNDDQAKATLEAIRAAGGKGECARFDITDTESSAEAVKAIVKAHGRIDILVNNAGIREDRLFALMKPEVWTKVVDTNLSGFYNVTRPVVRAMVKKKYGRIVSIASASGLTGNAGQVNYSASKAGLIGATKALAREMGKANITVNAVAPGFIQTDMLDGLDIEQLESTIPAGRLGTPEEVAHAVGFLCSDQASYITGQVIGVNGGMI
ncbi:MAG: 3-oxoacyl-ACP reductase FabG [Desulfobacteraceae bacterium]|mgnify:CR=1 FL=1|nr:MAG: 3-oxoacyl-ACP reductase FabG [Desulfobacteraceae bacterium]